LRRGASEGVYPQRSSTEQATKPQDKTAFARRVAALLAYGVVARRVKERCGYAPLLAPRHKPKSQQQTVFYPTVWGVTQFRELKEFALTNGLLRLQLPPKKRYAEDLLLLNHLRRAIAWPTSVDELSATLHGIDHTLQVDAKA
jgi:hypothetical protein